MTNPELAPVPIAQVSSLNEFLAWRVQQLEQRIDNIDKNGTHGIDSVRVLVQTLQNDFIGHENDHKEETREQRVGRRWFIGIVVAIIVPLYPFIGLLLFRK